ncbi:MAG: glucosaminidase domain-containing protein [Acidobacteriaceae bacterium]|nr:glucosaminidase domain-containing protein [Acidobacteriaceae bacterium]
MHVVYGFLWGRLSLVFKQITLLVGLFVLPVTTRLEKIAAAKPAPVAPTQPVESDPRTVRLKKFFSRLHCPVAYLADDFVHAADDNQLDWRLLPSISVVESGGGKAYRNNNIFGWNNGAQAFPTLRAGLNQVAFKLGRSPLYQGKDSVGKLRLYNPDENYVDTVVMVMRRISPVVNLQRVQRLIRHQNEFVYAAE